MKAIIPISITDSNLISTNVPEDDFAEYSSGTTYTTGQSVIVTATHSIYEALQGSTDKYPPDNLGGESPYWLLVGATNPWRAFDKYIGGSKVTNPESIAFNISPGLIGGIALFNIVGTSVTIEMVDPEEGTVYYSTTALYDQNLVYDGFTYFFSEFSVLEYIILTDLPLFLEAELRITINAESGQNAEVGEIVIGQIVDLGYTQYNLEFSIIDYSSKTVDTFGNYSVIPRAYSKTVSADIVVPNDSVAELFNLMSSIRTTPVVWVFTDDPSYASSMIIYGYFKDFSLVLEHPIFTNLSIQIEGLI